LKWRVATALPKKNQRRQKENLVILRL